MFERFTDRARRAVVLAQEEAREHNHHHIGTEHVLLGLIREEHSPGAEFLASLGVPVAGVREQVERTLGRGTVTPRGTLPFTPEAKRVLEDAHQESIDLGMNHIGPEHLALGLMREPDGIAIEVLGTYGIDLEAMRERVRDPAGRGAREFFARFTDRARHALMEGQEAARKLHHTHLGTEHILLGLFAAEGVAATALHTLGITRDAVRERLIRSAGSGTEPPTGAIPFTPRAKMALEMALKDALTLGHNYIGTEHLLLGLMREGEGTGGRLLREFATPQQVREEIIRILTAPLPEPPPVVVGREREIQHIMRILMRKSRHHALLVGEPGTGRTSIVAGFAQRIAQGDVPAGLAEVRLRAVDVATAAREAVEDPDRTVLFVDDVRAGDAEALRALVRKGPRIIAVTDPRAYGELRDVGAHFQTVPVGEPTHDEAVGILKLLRREYEAHHQVTITDAALDAAVTLSARHITDRVLPGKAVEVLDEAGARVRITDGAARTVDARHIAELFADRTAGEPSVDDRYVWAMS
ncbi:ATP-dependent Clp protease ATP-binding subunit [Streptomyces sp. NBRC 110028]|uniref:ATP-dependent Clp protease ATP-binding subunit n=1 Tax=Streptomyces sp. NBRC 110028 TaxID=1621260 RepID=UPI0006E2DB4A|nr:Clp protease N-terminal domain-containing protein [Streptomyces sp. NBRC 110028]